MTADKEKIQAMIIALNKFYEARTEIIELWYDDVDLNQLEYIKEYPFHLSFDEINFSDWIYGSIKELRAKI